MSKKYQKIGDIPIKITKTQISITFDMDWQKKDTGCNYDSNSDNAYLIVCRTENVIGMLVY